MRWLMIMFRRSHCPVPDRQLSCYLCSSEPTLTKLQLGYGQLKSTMEPWQSTSALLELLLQFCQISGTSFTSAQPALQTLVKLDINFCDLYAGALFLQPLHNLR